MLALLPFSQASGTLGNRRRALRPRPRAGPRRASASIRPKASTPRRYRGATRMTKEPASDEAGSPWWPCHAMPCLAKPCPAGGTVCQLAAGRQTRKRVTCGLSKDDENCHSAVPHRVSAAPGNRQRKGGPPSAPFPTEAGSLARVCTSPQFGQALLGRRESRAERRRAVSEMIGAAPPPPLIGSHNTRHPRPPARARLL